jgi:ceramide glucosyltransferase
VASTAPSAPLLGTLIRRRTSPTDSPPSLRLNLQPSGMDLGGFSARPDDRCGTTVFSRRRGGFKCEQVDRRSGWLHQGSQLIARELSAALGLVCLSVVVAYTLMALIAVLAWKVTGQTRRKLKSCDFPPVTLLKPLCGAEDQLYESLRSFFLQDYRQFQIVFGVSDSEDPAIEIVKRLALEFPQIPIELVADARQHGSNHKVSNLINMLPLAQHDVLAIVDSDACVGENYLQCVVAGLQRDDVGLVTCIYRSVPAAGVWSRLGALYVNDWYIPSVLLAWMFGHRRFASGQTLCLRKQTLECLGGLQSVCNHLADDYELSERVRAVGLKTLLSEYVTRSQLCEPTLDHLLDHETRWMRTLRSLRPHGFRFLFVSFGLPFALVGFALAHSLAALVAPSTELLATLVLAKLAVHFAAHWDDERVNLSDLWLIPTRDLLLLWVWWRALRTSQVSWRGHRFSVDSQGVMSVVR